VRAVRIFVAALIAISQYHTHGAPKGSLKLDVWYFCKESIQDWYLRCRQQKQKCRRTALKKADPFLKAESENFQDSKRRSRFHTLSLSLTIYLSLSLSIHPSSLYLPVCLCLCPYLLSVIHCRCTLSFVLVWVPPR
jgi:hypothetical protein